ncbi:MAG: cytochrome c peroxidase [Gammaproteobacteria bacterium]
MSRPAYILLALSAAALVVWFGMAWWPASAWSDDEKRLISSLWIGSLPPVPDDPSNAVDTVPLAAELGHALFFDARLSANNQISCAFCHRPDMRFTDRMDKASALGQSRRNTPSIVGLAFSPWLYWDGRRDSLWSQALSPLEDPQEQGGNRMAIARLVTSDKEYASQYEIIFRELPDFSDRSRFPDNAAPDLNNDWSDAWAGMMDTDQQLVNQTFANVGKAIAAYERLMVPSPSRFDQYAEAIINNDAPGDIFSNDEVKGLRLFIGKGRCMECHNGPLFTNNEFHNTGILSYPGDLPDRGRIDGVREVRQNKFNCLGPYSDAGEGQCLELTHAREGIELIGALKTPSLRNLAGTAPYMHKGQIATLSETLNHYNRAPLAMIGHNEAEEPLGLLPFEIKQLEAFLLTLTAPVAVDEKWLKPPQ